MSMRRQSTLLAMSMSRHTDRKLAPQVCVNA
eukprot:COSAG03_NODE_15558_length_427_cov_1.362805_1_plen_30_part_01